MAPSNVSICVWANFISDILGLALKTRKQIIKVESAGSLWVLTRPCRYLETLTSLQMSYSQDLFQSITTSFWT